MDDKKQGKILVIQEGNVRKGGINSKPSSPRPTSSIQGFGPLPHSSSSGSTMPFTGSPQDSQNNQNGSKN